MKENKNILNNQHLKENPFSVPEDYFESNALKLKEKILCSESTTFEIPEDYFETSRLKLFEKILSNHQEPFSIPEHYFEHNREKLHHPIISKPSAKNTGTVIRLFRYSMASAAALILILGMYLIYQSQTADVKPINDCKTIACLTKKDILLKEQLLDEEILEESVNDAMIEEHFDLSDPQSNSNLDSNQLNETF